ncbi:MAG: hypothetical protein ABI585_15565 [Betaproteobacteria bacterium]
MPVARQGPASAAAVVALAFAALATAAQASPTCYTVYDRGGEIAYRDTVAPFEGALDPASPGRDAMRQRGEHLVFFEADFCPASSRVVGLGSLSGRPPTTDEIVAGFPSMGSRGNSPGAPSSISGGGVSAPMAPAPAPSGGPAARIAAPAVSAGQTRVGTYR